MMGSFLLTFIYTTSKPVRAIVPRTEPSQVCHEQVSSFGVPLNRLAADEGDSCTGSTSLYRQAQQGAPVTAAGSVTQLACLPIS
jgi:hypothetical protein